jgi:hypothetical protein
MYVDILLIQVSGMYVDVLLIRRSVKNKGDIIKLAVSLMSV